MSCSDDGTGSVGAVEARAVVDHSDWKVAAEGATESTVARGERIIQMCAGCHGIGEGAPSPAGPSLHGIMGRRVGSLDSYPYTQALTNQTESWTVKQFDEFITSPQDLYPGTGMAFSGLKSREDRAALIAYLATKSLP
ncbi:c-type cytochrome [Dasania marina]|uniref:c-type cytochrome n=1 Tax=Dasania marina TaxID=471499 RepID=UPI0030DBD32F